MSERRLQASDRLLPDVFVLRKGVFLTCHLTSKIDISSNASEKLCEPQECDNNDQGDSVLPLHSKEQIDVISRSYHGKLLTRSTVAICSASGFDYSSNQSEMLDRAESMSPVSSKEGSESSDKENQLCYKQKSVSWDITCMNLGKSKNLKNLQKAYVKSF